MDTLIDTALASATQSCRLTPFSLLALEPQRTAPPSYMAVQPALGRLGIGWVDGWTDGWMNEQRDEQMDNGWTTEMTNQ